MSYFFFLCQSSSSSFCMVLDSISSKIDEVLSINPSANSFVFWDFSIYHKDWLTYSGGTDQPDKLCYDFSISNHLIQIVNFPTKIPDCDSHSHALTNFIFLLMLVFVLQCLSLHCKILIMLSQFPLTFHQIRLLSAVSKVFEKLVNNSIADQLDKCDLFSDFQYGFGLLNQL